MLNEWSLDLLEKPPATFPWPTIEEYQTAWNYKEQSPFCSVIDAEKPVYLIQSETRIGEQANWSANFELQQFTAEMGWKKYVELRSSIYMVQPSVLFTGLYTCSCFKGRKDQVFCKHALALMCCDGKYSYPEEISDIPIGGRCKRGRKRKATKGGALVIDE
uniref:SWIM-type domain-containing protein n=1 Tax=Ditylenchus dipsaci TaxID=166011 RepID=A0A915D6F0_9BILA